MGRSTLLLALCVGFALPAAIAEVGAQEPTVKVPEADVRLTARQRDRIFKSYVKAYVRPETADPVQLMFSEAAYYFNAYLDERGERREIPELFSKAYPMLAKLAGRGHVTLQNVNCRTQAIHYLARIFREGLGEFSADNLRAQFYDRLAVISENKAVDLAKAADEGAPSRSVDANRYHISRSIEGTRFAIIADNNSTESNRYGVGILDANSAIARIIVPATMSNRLQVVPFKESKRWKSFLTKSGQSYRKSPIQGQMWERALSKPVKDYTKAPEKSDFKLDRVFMYYAPQTMVAEDMGESVYAAGSRVGEKWIFYPLTPDAIAAKTSEEFICYDLFRNEWE